MDFVTLLMEPNHLPRHELIGSLLVRRSQKVADIAIPLWEQMAAQLISIIGEEGFDSLYARSLSLSQVTFSWLACGLPPPRTDHRFAGLRTILDAQTPAQACEANRLLLITFTDILASLIGEQLTTRILRLAWSPDISNKTGKEFKHE